MSTSLEPLYTRWRLLKDPVKKEGLEAVLRTFVNVGVSVSDLLPGIGIFSSWVLDATKAWARYRHLQEQARVAAAGGDPRSVKLSKLDLTPDVSLKLALGTELFEIIGAGILPTHLIETLWQLRYDMPRMRRLFTKITS